MAKNYYLILGVDPDASSDQIKAAYRQKARFLHPDVSGADMRPFCDLQEAYSVLRDPARRRGYDDALSAHRWQRRRTAPRVEPMVTRRREVPAEPLAPPGREPDLDHVSLTRSFQTYAPSFDEIFDYLWSNYRELERPKAEQVRSLGVEITLTPEEAEQGGQARILVPARVPCPTCRGAGSLGLYECWRCAGEGAISGEFPISFSFPPGLPDRYAIEVPMDHLGISNCYLTVQLRVSREA